MYDLLRNDFVGNESLHKIHRNITISHTSNSNKTRKL